MSSENSSDLLNLNQLAVPDDVFHVKPGNTLCSNGNMFIYQDGPTSVEIRTLPKLECKKVPWCSGLVRDICWSPDFEVFIFLTKTALFRLDPSPLLIPERPTNRPIVKLSVHTYSKVKPYDNEHAFWRCVCAGTSLYISYAGYGSVIDEYSLGKSTCTFVNRWMSPKTCAVYEGIWCIRYQPEIDQLGLAIMDARNGEWRFEARHRQDFTTVWQIVLPLSNGDCEISPLPNQEWLAVNSCGIRLIQIANQKLKSSVEYERELKNAISINSTFFAVRTKNTLEIHEIKPSK